MKTSPAGGPWDTGGVVPDPASSREPSAKDRGKPSEVIGKMGHSENLRVGAAAAPVWVLTAHYADHWVEKFGVDPAATVEDLGTHFRVALNLNDGSYLVFRKPVWFSVTKEESQRWA